MLYLRNNIIILSVICMLLLMTSCSKNTRTNYISKMDTITYKYSSNERSNKMGMSVADNIKNHSRLKKFIHNVGENKEDKIELIQYSNRDFTGKRIYVDTVFYFNRKVIKVVKDYSKNEYSQKKSRKKYWFSFKGKTKIELKRNLQQYLDFNRL